MSQFAICRFAIVDSPYDERVRRQNDDYDDGGDNGGDDDDNGNDGLGSPAGLG